MAIPYEATDGQILQIIPAPLQFQAKFGARQAPVFETPIICQALVKRGDGETIEGVVVDQGKLTLVSEIKGFLGLWWLLKRSGANEQVCQDI
ncbi:MAG TPA: hypothetical protein VH540_06625 [Ktedonobacterales bacterium]|jgi:hypothetical protein